MKNSEIAKSLLELANVYGTTPDDKPMCGPNLFVHVYTKQEVIDLIHAIGGKFKKRPLLGEDSSMMIFSSVRIPGFDIWVPRDKICRKIPARYECEPLLSPEDEAEILVAE